MKNGKKRKTSASPISKNGNGSNLYGRYVQNRLEIEYGIKYNPKLAKEMSSDLEALNKTIEILKSEGKLPSDSLH